MSTSQQAISGNAADDMVRRLQEINNKTLGTSAGAFPVVTLPNGDVVPTGTVGALLINIRSYDTGNNNERVKTEQAIRATVPVLKKAGMFDLFAPDEWQHGGSPGRALVGRLALELED